VRQRRGVGPLATPKTFESAASGGNFIGTHGKPRKLIPY
jgi:hypothetical protein